MKEKFIDLGLSKKVLDSIQKLGYETPTKIQQEVIPFILKGNDVIGKAQTGTGKTLAYAASILSKMDVSDNIVKAIILVPTRELALQVSEEFNSLNTEIGFDILPIYGGTSIEQQIRALKKGVDIVVGTPGRIIDLIKRKALFINNVDYFVLDEADEMLNMGFLDDIEYIFKTISHQKQVLLFSATMPEEIKKISEKYMSKDYQYVGIEEVSKTSINVSQYYYLVNEKMMAEALSRVIDSKDIKSAIIFCKTKRECDKLLTELSNRNYSVEVMHGDIMQNSRIETLERFKQGTFKYLIATDVAARGIHVDNIECVINYGLPQDMEAYIHRIGRTGRASNTGEAISFITPKEIKYLNQIEKYVHCKIEKSELPNTVEIVKNKYDKIIKQTSKIIDDKTYLEAITYVRDLNKGDLINLSASLLKMCVDKEIGSDLNKEINVTEINRKIVTEGTTRIFITIGKMDNLKKGSLLDFLKDVTKVDKDNFKNIEILTKFTFIDVTNEVVDIVIKKLYNQKFNNRIVRVEKAKLK